MTKEEKDLIQRAQDIQRYTENRCNTLEERIAEQEETIDAQDEKINFYVSKMNENILKRQALEKENEELKIDIEIADSQRQLAEKEKEELEKENAELKAKLKGFENGDVAWQGDMDKTIKQNLELKEQIERISVTNFDVIKKLKEQIGKMQNVGNCKHAMDCAKFNEKEFIYGKLITCKNCKKWELAE